MITDHETGHDHRERAGKMPIGCESISSGDDGERDEDFDLIIVDSLEQVIAEKSDRNAESDSAEDLV